MERDQATTRRRVLAVAASFGLVAGCTTNDSGGGQPDEAERDSGGSKSDDTDLDLTEANVVGVSVDASGSEYTFDVSLHHDDDGEDGYANWWQVERLDGTRLGRRELLHAHSQQPFTRAETIEISDSIDCVVVRGHDQTHGYGGQAGVVVLDSGAVSLLEQGSTKQPFTATDCPS